MREILWILGLAMLSENARCNLRNLVDEMECLILCNFWSFITEFIESAKARILEIRELMKGQTGLQRMPCR
jgi:hypothetical protein